MDRGYLQIYTGNGRGKTLAALGLALRAAGAGLKTLLIQFMKEGHPYSELDSIRALSELITVESYGGEAHVVEKRPPTDEERAVARKGLERAQWAMEERAFDLVILDEICPAAHFGLIAEAEVAALFDIRPRGIELVLTGRYCPPGWFERADLVTEMVEIKHYYREGVLSRKGIDC